MSSRRPPRSHAVATTRRLVAPLAVVALATLAAACALDVTGLGADGVDGGSLDASVGGDAGIRDGSGYQDRTAIDSGLPPTIASVVATAAPEGSRSSLAAALSDPEGAPLDVSIDWGDATPVEELFNVPSGPFTREHVYARDRIGGSYAAVLRVSDGQKSVQANADFAVTNVAPIVSAGADETIGSAVPFTRAGSFVDPGDDAFTATVDYGAGTGPEPLALTGKTFALSHTYPTPGTFTVTVAVLDGGTTATATFTLTVATLDYFAGGTWAASYWNRSGKATGSCDQGDAFDTATGNIAVAPAATASEPLLFFPRAAHPYWKTLPDAPAPNVDKDFCARFERTIALPAGTYTMKYIKDDGVRVYVDGVALVNDWSFTPNGTAQQTVPWTNPLPGNRTFRVLFRDNGNDARLEVQFFH